MRLVYRRKNPTSQAWEAVVHDYAAGTTTVLGQILASQGNFTIAGDGKSAWIHGRDARLVRIAIDTLGATDAGGRHAWCRSARVRPCSDRTITCSAAFRPALSPACQPISAESLKPYLSRF